MDELQLNFSPTTLFVLNIILGLILFGVALDLKLADFKRITQMPKEVLVGLFGQLILLPALTVLLIVIINPAPSLALGMILVASCPGGNLSNFMTYHAKGNAALSVTLTIIATLVATVGTPFNFFFWGSRLSSTNELIEQINVPILQMVITVALLIVVPLSIGLYISEKHPNLAAKWKKPMKYFSLVFFGAFIVVALLNNWDAFVKYLPIIFGLVALHNFVAFAGGYGMASIFGIKNENRRAITLEVGLQNSGLGLILIFNFFGGMGGMALIAAFWGIWHIISGFTLASIFRNYKNL